MTKLVMAWSLLVAVGCTNGDENVPAGMFGATCTTVVDTGSTECDSGVCTDSFDMIGHPVCSAKCTAGDGSTCPAGSEGKKCNMKGYCKP